MKSSGWLSVIVFIILMHLVIAFIADSASTKPLASVNVARPSPTNSFIEMSGYIQATTQDHTTPYSYASPASIDSTSTYSPSSGVTNTVSGYCNDGTYVTGSPSAKGKANACYGHRGWRDY